VGVYKGKGRGTLGWVIRNSWEKERETKEWGGGYLLQGGKKRGEAVVGGKNKESTGRDWLNK